MKRHGFLIDSIADENNIREAHRNARKGKTYQRSIKAVDKHIDTLAPQLAVDLLTGQFHTGNYSERIMCERGKQRVIHRLPYWPDRVVHHAICQVLKPIWRASLIRHTYASIPGRGIHDARDLCRKQMRQDPDGTRYVAKLDVAKFYPSIPHDGLMTVLERQVKDAAALRLLDDIVRSIDITSQGIGIPIGNYLSQWFANVYLAGADWRMKQHYKVRYYHRYCDDMVLMDGSKGRLHAIVKDFSEWLPATTGLRLKANWQVFPLADRGLDFVGYRMWPEKTLLRKGSKKRMAAKLSVPNARRSAHHAWAAHVAAPSYDGLTRAISSHDLRARLLAPITEGVLA